MVRLHRLRGGYVLDRAEMSSESEFAAQDRQLNIPKSLRSNYAALACSSARGSARVLRMAGAEEAMPEDRIRTMLSVDESFRVGSALIDKGRGRQESTYLAAAMAEEDVQRVLCRFPSGPPAPLAVEISGLATLTAFRFCCGDVLNQAGGVLHVEVGESSVWYAFFEGGSLRVVGKINTGMARLRELVRTELGVEEPLVRSILRGGSVDVGGLMEQVFTPVLRQVTLSRDYLERQHRCRLRRVFILGGGSAFPRWHEALQSAMGITPEGWHPFEALTVDGGALDDTLQGQENRFAAAVGAAIGVLEAL
ncbi:type IV pilus assembly protein PilM [Kiritimatiella glycovorans]|uniref:Type IV pilus assembly protein PilM n=2 Tax=Kiritimatiella glycovorans TaxID=1307763 RepID=A0A0G3EB90_9BACT|nr:type IV pilus assembly protein PilM [Kiritimatiella glycovorans]